MSFNRFNQKDAATIIQKNIRRHLAEKHYAINQLDDNTLESYPTFVVGNDPKIKHLHSFKVENEQIALLATSGIRAIEIACKLGNQNHVPKIILIDNSKEVYEFWYALRDFMQNATLTGTRSLFRHNFANFLKTNQNLYRDIPDDCYEHQALPGVIYPKQNIPNYFEKLFDKYGYEYIQHMVINTSLIKQSWADPTVLVKSKNILNLLEINNIFVYASNIALCISDLETRDKVLENIEKISPKLAIHTDLCDVHCHPENVYLLTNHNPNDVKMTLSSNLHCQGSNQLSLQKLLLLLLLKPELLESLKHTVENDETNALPLFTRTGGFQ